MNPTIFSIGQISKDADIVFVADFFADQVLGGAELSTQALIDSSPYKVAKIKSQDVGELTLQSGKDKMWVICNYANINFNALRVIASSFKYFVVEYDYKFCSHRSIEKHTEASGKDCDCHESPRGKFVGEMLYKNALGVFWMSEAQKSVYESRFSAAKDYKSVVLSSVFDDAFFAAISSLRNSVAKKNDKYVVLDSKSWIKGTDAAETYCKENSLPYEKVGNVSYDDMLLKLASSKGLVYLPPGGDTCPRMVIEAKLLGCDLILNDNVQHAKEDWFVDADVDATEAYLYAARRVFWEAVKLEIERKRTISGYVTTRNCIQQGYPFLECIDSLLAFCDEVCIVDSGSTDGTFEALSKLASVTQDGRLGKSVKIRQVDLDWNNARFSVYDGMNKATAREMCTGDFCWQQDSDEIVDVSDAKKIRDMIDSVPLRGDYVVALPVLEYWGGPEKIRIDATPWKWRVSPNSKNITHGIPCDMRALDSDGNICAREGTDGCDVISKDKGERIPVMTFYTPEADQCRQAALAGVNAAIDAYANWFKSVSENIPTVYHYSWYDMKRKIRLYRDYWTKHWNSLYDQNVEDSAETNMFFDAAWKDVSEEQIDELAEKLSRETGGWIFHKKWRGQKIPHISFETKNPLTKYRRA